MKPTISRKFPLACATRALGALVALVALAGCSGEVLVNGASAAAAGTTSGASTGEGAGGSPGSSGSVGGAGGECVPDPAAGLPAVVVEDATSGVFIQGTLHLSASVGGEPAHYTVVKLADGVGYVVNQPTDLDGPANLAPVEPGTAARVVSKGGVLRVELINVSTPTMPFTTASFTLDGTVPAGFWKVFSVVDKHLFTCLTTPPATDAVLVDVPLDGSPPAPVVVEPSWDHVCSAQGFADDSGTARGAVWLTWGYDSDLKIFDVTPQGAKKQGEYNYSPDGVHHYGAVLSAATDGERIVFDPANDSEVFLYTPGSSVDYITHAYFGIAGPKQLLAVVGKVSYWATAKGVRAYDVEDINAPKLLDFHADADFGEGLAALVAEDPERLAVVDAEGRLYVIPLGSSGPVAPLKTYLGAPAPGSTGSCGSP